MCRSIKPLFNLEPVATEAEIRAAALQYVRKVSGLPKPTKANEAAFLAAVEQISQSTAQLLASITTSAAPRDRAVEAAKARARTARRFPAAGKQAG